MAFGSSLALAQGRLGALELSPFFGAYFFDDDLDLKHNPYLGARVGYWLTDRWEAELSAEGLRTKNDDDSRASVFQTHSDILYHFNPAPGIQPYLAAGLGAARYKGADEHDGGDWDGLINYGVGIKAWVTDSIALRMDARQPVTFGSTNFNWMFNVGLSFLLGGEKPVVKAAAVAPPAPPAPVDSDKDGVPDASDACPGTPADVKVDAKGCPLDTDGDGVYDYLDKCPGTPRGTAVDKNGCPAPAAVKATISVQPDSIEAGDSAKLSWATQGASEVSIEGLGKVDPNGSKTVSPKESTTYRLTASGPGGKQEATTSLRVTPPKAPTASLTASQAEIPAGASSTLTWKTENASDVAIDRLGAVTPNGSRAVSPEKTTTYRLTAKGPGGSKDATATVTVIPPPPPAAKPEKVELTANFDTNSDVVKPQYFPEVERVAKYLKDHPKTNVIIEGHTDNVGSEEYNLKLSARRANSIAKLLTSKYGIAMERITAQSLGETKPIADNNTKEGRAKNRRIYAYIENQ